MATLVPELQAVEKAHELLRLTYREIADAINATESTLHRWRKAEGPAPTPVFLARLEALDAFFIELGRTFRDWKDARAWLDQEIPYLQNRTPRDMILSGHVDRVTGVLYALNAGIPTVRARASGHLRGSGLPAVSPGPRRPGGDAPSQPARSVPLQSCQ